MRSPRVRDLSIAEIEQIAEQFKQDLQRKKDGFIRKDENKDAYAALLGQEYIDQFIWNLKLRSE